MRKLLPALAVLLLAASAVEAQAPALPAKADLGPEFQKLDLAPGVQGGRDTCSLFAVTSLAEFECARAAPPPGAHLSEEFLIWAAHEASGRKGDQAMFYEAVLGLDRFGVCREDLMRYERHGDAARRPSAAALADAESRRARWRVHWLRRWNVSRPLADAELLAIMAALAAGHPVACGLRWPSSLRSHELIDVPPPDKVYDGHSIVLAGYADDPKHPGGGAFTFRNWLGSGWGSKGCGVMSYTYVRAYANDALWLQLGPPGSETPIERFEAASPAVTVSGRCPTSTQEMGPMWGRRSQLFCRAREGDSVDLAFEVRKTGRRRVALQATAAPDYAVVRASLDGKPITTDFDLYCGRVSPTGTLELGTFDLPAGRHTLRLTAVGKNAASAGFFFGLDAIDLLPPD